MRQSQLRKLIGNWLGFGSISLRYRERYMRALYPNWDGKLSQGSQSSPI